MAENRDPVRAPRNRDKALRAAYFRLIGYSLRDAASSANIGTRTLERYESCSWWQDLLAEADRKYLSELTAKSRQSLLKGVEKDSSLALRVVERLIPELAPPAQRMNVDATIGVETSDARSKLEDLVNRKRNEGDSDDE